MVLKAPPTWIEEPEKRPKAFAVCEELLRPKALGVLAPLSLVDTAGASCPVPLGDHTGSVLGNLLNQHAYNTAQESLDLWFLRWVRSWKCLWGSFPLS